MTQQLEARAFAIWRFAQPLDWDVSMDEIADAVGLTRSQVNNAISAKGWGGKIGMGRNAGSRDNGIRAAHMLHKRAGRRFDDNALDVVDLMSF